MEKSKIRDVEKKFDAIMQISWFKAIFKWTLIKSEISELKLDYSEISREVSVNRNQIESMTAQVGEFEKIESIPLRK